MRNVNPTSTTDPRTRGKNVGVPPPYDARAEGSTRFDRVSLESLVERVISFPCQGRDASHDNVAGCQLTVWIVGTPSAWSDGSTGDPILREYHARGRLQRKMHMTHRASELFAWCARRYFSVYSQIEVSLTRTTVAIIAALFGIV